MCVHSVNICVSALGQAPFLCCVGTGVNEAEDLPPQSLHSLQKTDTNK